jgi:hypothetical protein
VIDVECSSCGLPIDQVGTLKFSTRKTNSSGCVKDPSPGVGRSYTARTVLPPRASLSDNACGAHRWAANLRIPVSGDQASIGHFRGYSRLKQPIQVLALNVIGGACGQQYCRAATGDCDAAAPMSSGRRDHLLGGTPGERARRAVTEKSDRNLVLARESRTRRKRLESS